MTALIKKLYASDVVRYVFFGGCTTLVNLVNSKFVFQDKCETLKDHIRPFCKFVGARGVTMVIEVAGVWFFAEIIHMNDMAGKFITQFVVLALNYIFSKFLVFTSGRKS